MENPRSRQTSDLSDLPKPVIISGIIKSDLLFSDMPEGVSENEWMLENSDVISRLISEYSQAESDIVCAPTWLSNRALLNKSISEHSVLELNSRLVELTRAATSKRVAGVISETGLAVEPFGEATFDELLEIYSEQSDALNSGEVDAFFIRDMTSLVSARAAVFACRKYKKPIFLTVLVNEKGKLGSGASAICALTVLQELGISAFGISADHEDICDEISAILPFAHIPIIAAFSAGDKNPVLRNLYELSPNSAAVIAKELLDMGVYALSDGDGITTSHIKAISEAIRDYKPETAVDEDFSVQESDMLLANETDFFAIDNDRIELSEPVFCEFDMADSLLLASEENAADVIVVSLQTIDDAEQFAQNAHFTKLPVCFRGEDPIVLERALLLYNGRALVDGHSQIELEMLKVIASKYGAMIY